MSPARVRSRISSRSNSASAAKMPNTRRPAAVVVSICAPCPVSTRRPTPRVDRSCTVLTRWARVRPRRSSFQSRARRPSGARARSCRVPVGRRERRTRSRGGRGQRRRSQPAARRAAGPATGSRLLSRRGRSRSACVVNGRLRHTRESALRRAPPCIPCLILCLAYVERVCRCGAPHAPCGLHGRMASAIASRVSRSRPVWPLKPLCSAHAGSGWRGRDCSASWPSRGAPARG